VSVSAPGYSTRRRWRQSASASAAPAADALGGGVDAAPEGSRSDVPNSVDSARQHPLMVLLSNKVSFVGIVVIVILALFSFLGPFLYHTNQTTTRLLLQNLAPSSKFPLGTDPEGRNELGRLMLGGQSSLEVGFGVAFISTVFGLAWGAVAGYVGGILDTVMMRIVDAFLAIPLLFFIVFLASVIQPNLFVILLVISLGSWMGTARLVRGEVLSLREREYVAASVLFGASSRRILVRHLVPNVLGVVVVAGTFCVADSILAFSAMAFLGLGLPPPSTSWGDLLTVGINNVFDGFWWQLWPPATALVLVELAVNVVGDGLRDVTEQRLVRR
jgi:peptide/nickel transport system permease protein